MHRGMNSTEQSKDFKGSMLRLFKSLDRWRYLLIVSVIFALLASVLSAIAPNKLADVTDVISEGIKPNVENIQLISEEMMRNMKMPDHTTDWRVVSEENQEDMGNYFAEFEQFDEHTQRSLLSEIEVKGVKISVDDQLQFMNVLSSIDSSMVTDDLLEKLDELPASIQSLVEPKLDMNELEVRSIMLAVIYLLNALFGYVQGILMAYVANGYSKKLRMDISGKINSLPLRYFDSHETGDILSRVTNDVDTIGINMSNNITSFVANITLFFGSIVMMFVTNWVMALTAIAASIVGFVFSFFLLKKSQKYFVNRQRRLGELNGHIEEIYSGHNVVKTYNGEKAALEEFDQINEQLYDCNRKSQFLSGIMQPLMGFIGNFGYVAVCVVGALLVMNGMTSFGVIVAFMIYIRLFTNPLSRIAQSLTAMQSIAAASERVFEFMDEEELPDESQLKGRLKVEDAHGNIEFKHVHFGYDEKRTIIKDFSASVKAGEKIAIVGPTGAGKTTMVNLLMKFYDIKDGDILIDGVSIKDLPREVVHDLFVMVLQDTWLFNGTVKENIQFNHKRLTDDELWDICKTVGINHFIKTLPGNMKAMVYDNDSISSGQKQLLTIARGMTKDAPFLILDEATSNVDTRTEELVQKAMDKLTEGKTSFIIAHRLSTIKNADLILVMDDGNIIEQGTHDELLKKDGFYANLYNSQFQK